MRPPQPLAPKDRYGIAITIALVFHLIVLIALAINLPSASQTAAPVAQVEASLIDTPEPSAPPAPATPTPSHEKSTPTAIKTPPPSKAQTPPTTPIPVTTTPVPLETKNTIAPPPKPLVKIKQQSLAQALQQELHQESQTLSKPVTKKILDQSLSSEISSESQQLKKAASSSHPANTKSSSPTSTTNTAEVDRYKGMILQQIQQNWIVPQNVEHLSCVLQVELAPGGMVLKVSLLHSSGNEALDRSAISAVNNASPLPVPKNSSDFAAFRSFTLTVKPEGASFDG